MYTTIYVFYTTLVRIRFVILRPFFSARRGNGKESTAIRHPCVQHKQRLRKLHGQVLEAAVPPSRSLFYNMLPPPLTLSSGLMFVSKETSFFSTSPTDGPPVLISGMATPAAMFSFCFQYQSRNGKGIQSGTAVRVCTRHMRYILFQIEEPLLAASPVYGWVCQLDSARRYFGCQHKLNQQRRAGTQCGEQ